jgi:hypothetical protein
MLIVWRTGSNSSGAHGACMHYSEDQTVRTAWFSRNSLILVALSAPAWLIAGLGWGGLMYLGLGGNLLGWMITGIGWGVICGFFTTLCLLLLMREIALRIRLVNPESLAQRLAEAARRQKYSIEQKSPEIFVCKPSSGLPRLLDCNQVSVQVEQGALLLTGPAAIVKKMRKQI